MRARPERLRIRWSRVSALAGLELRGFLRRRSAWGVLLGVLITMQAAKRWGEMWFLSKGVGGPDVSRAVLDTLTWGFLAATFAVFDAWWEKRTNREIEPVLATGMREMEILLGKVAVPAGAALVAGCLVLAGQVGFWILVPGLAPPRPGAALLWLLLFLPPFGVGAANLVTVAGLWFRSPGAATLVLLLAGGVGISAAWVWIAAAPRFPIWIGIPAWLAFAAAVVGSLRAASGLLRRDRMVTRV